MVLLLCLLGKDLNEGRMRQIQIQNPIIQGVPYRALRKFDWLSRNPRNVHDSSLVFSAESFDFSSGTQLSILCVSSDQCQT